MNIIRHHLAMIIESCLEIDDTQIHFFGNLLDHFTLDLRVLDAPSFEIDSDRRAEPDHWFGGKLATLINQRTEIIGIAGRQLPVVIFVTYASLQRRWG